MTTERLERLNRAESEEAVEMLLACCGSRAWACAMAERRPFADTDEATAASDEIWWGLEPRDWLEAFAAHPRIGERGAAVRRSGEGEGGGSERPAAGRSEEGPAAAWSREEQAGTDGAPDETLRALEAGNRRYEQRFGHVFLIRAAGRSATDMLAALTQRISNDPQAELRVAAAQQAEITRLRLARLLEGA